MTERRLVRITGGAFYVAGYNPEGEPDLTQYVNMGLELVVPHADDFEPEEEGAEAVFINPIEVVEFVATPRSLAHFAKHLAEISEAAIEHKRGFIKRVLTVGAEEDAKRAVQPALDMEVEETAVEAAPIPEPDKRAQFEHALDNTPGGGSQMLWKVWPSVHFATNRGGLSETVFVVSSFDPRAGVGDGEWLLFPGDATGEILSYSDTLFKATQLEATSHDTVMRLAGYDLPGGVLTI